MKLNNLNNGNVGGLKRTDPGLGTPTSNSMISRNKMEDDTENDISTADQALKTQEIMDTQKISDPNRNIADIRKPPNINNIPA